MLSLGYSLAERLVYFVVQNAVTGETSDCASSGGYGEPKTEPSEIPTQCEHGKREEQESGYQVSESNNHEPVADKLD
ncbi:hypothetical protein [Glutamicibacter arilaitensis]|uniref:hypothetical protein n=1 Tax=Glutamicibacter arilaitensis TaxID=256701 RepID=UPI003FD0121C